MTVAEIDFACDGCGKEPTRECACSRCSRETPDERYHACDDAACESTASGKHRRVRSREVVWCPL